jgi:Uma2 family endonuclease
MDWPGDGTGRPFQLIDGEPVAMAPASPAHGRLQARLAKLIGNHLDATRPGCEVITAPGVKPQVNHATNVRVSDLVVTCEPHGDRKTVEAPVLIVEILSPSNARESREAARALVSRSSVQEVLLLYSEEIGAEVSRRMADGGWDPEPVWYGAADDLVLESIGFRLPMRELYAGLNLR